MHVSSLQLCATSVITRAFCEDSNSDPVKQIFDEILYNRSLDPCLEIILQRIVSTHPTSISDSLLFALLSGGIHLKSLELRKCTNVSIVGLAMALKCQPCIEHLDLSKCNQLAHSSIADVLGRGTPHLKSLIFESCQDMKDSTVQAIIRSCDHLSYISLACSPWLTDNLFFFGSKNAIEEKSISVSLTGIDLSGCKGITMTTIRQLASLCGPNLRKINISWTNIDCISLVYLSGYSLSSAVFLATSAHDKDVPFTVEELEAAQQYEFEMVPKYSDNFESNSHVAKADSISSSDKISNITKPCNSESSIDTANQSSSGGIIEPSLFTDKVSKSSLLHASQNLADKDEHISEECSDEGVDARLPNIPLNAPTAKMHLENTQITAVAGSPLCNEISCDTSCEDDRAAVRVCNSIDESKDNKNESSVCKFDDLHDVNIHDAHRTETFDTFSSDRIDLSRTIYVGESSTGEQSLRPSDIESASVFTTGGRSNINSSANTTILPKSNVVDCKANQGSQSLKTIDSSINCVSNIGSEMESLTLNSLDNCAAVDKLNTFSNAAHSKADETFDHGTAVDDTPTDRTSKELHCHSIPISVPNPEIYRNPTESMAVSASKSSTGAVTEPLNSFSLGSDEINDSYKGRTLPCPIKDPRSMLYVPRQLFSSRITELDISEIKFYEYAVGVDCLKMFVSANHCLRALNISWKLLDDNVLGFIAKNEPELTDIGLVDCESLSNSGLKMLGEHCKKLCSVDLQGVPFVGDEGLVEILKNGLLWKLSLAESAVTDITLRNIANNCSPVISNLDLSWCENLTDQGIAHLIRLCPHLKLLNLRQCEASAETMDALKDNGEGLTFLGISSIQEITDSMAISCLHNMRHLTFIDLSWNCLLTDKTVSTLFSSCGMLVEVILSGLKQITSKPFLPIISGLVEWRSKRELITNRLRRRDLISRDYGLQEVYEPDFYLPHRSIHYVPNLQKINVSFSDKVNDTHLAEIVSVCRGTLRIDDYYSVPIKPRWRI